jgi:hypothetical protein
MAWALPPVAFEGQSLLVRALQGEPSSTASPPPDLWLFKRRRPARERREVCRARQRLSLFASAPAPSVPAQIPAHAHIPELDTYLRPEQTNESKALGSQASMHEALGGTAIIARGALQSFHEKPCNLLISINAT